eukprot:2414535-Pyramimonas_sp.AAC.1
MRAVKSQQLAGAQALASSEAVNLSLQVATQIEAEVAAEGAAPQARCAEARPCDDLADSNPQSRPPADKPADNATVAEK